ncbi:MAG: hypothetical protein Q7J23_07125, partial [Nitrosomonas sp.]|nr:hypothetical protein [Nitrosomonas sp.]
KRLKGQNSILGDKKVHAQRNSVCACLPIHLKPEFLLGSAYLIAEFLSKLYVGSTCAMLQRQKREPKPPFWFESKSN